MQGRSFKTYTAAYKDPQIDESNYAKLVSASFTNIQPNTQETLRAPDSERGLNVDYQFSEIYSKKMHFYYPSNSGNEADPYFYK